MNPVRPILSFAALASMSAALALLGAAGCGDDGEGGSAAHGAGGAGGSSTGPFTLSGIVSYERVPYSASDQGLNYADVAARPIRGASVRVVGAQDNAELGRTVSGDDGAYTVTYEGTSRVKLWIYAETDLPKITVADNTAEGAVYVLESAEIDAATTPEIDVTATTGWDGAAYSGARQSAPFAVLDSAYEAARRFRTEVTPAPEFPELTINWSVNNRPESGSEANGAIETSHWDGQELYILGKEGVDTDEFDDHVIVHEWGHYFESRLSRSDSIGGTHAYGDLLDARVALSEGWGNALSAMILDPNTTYADSSGVKQAEGFSYDLEVNDTSVSASPGWYSESTVENVLFDIYDPANEPFDGIALGLPGVYAVMSGPLKETPAATTLFAFITGAKSEDPGQAAALDALVAHHAYDAALGVDPVGDAWGAGETHSGGVGGTLPVFADGDAGGAINLAMTGGADYNMLAQNRFIRLTGTGGQVTVTSTCTSDVDLYVTRSGVDVASATSISGDEQVTFNTTSGTIYVINVEGFERSSQSYTAVIDITP
jgi:hypothetical protein